MAITAAQAKLRLSFDMVAKTMTVFVLDAIQEVVEASGGTYALTGYTLTDPLGNTYDIDEIETAEFTQVFDAPLDSDSKVLNGAYTIDGYAIDIDIPGDDTYTFAYLDSEYTLSYTAPTVSLSASINCITPSFVSTDSTDYRVIDPTSQGYITPATVSYAHNLYYPATSNGYPSNATLTSALIITRGADEFYQGTQTAIVTHLVSYTFVDGLIVTDTITDDLETLVDCATLLCGITCGENALYQTMQANKTANNTLYLQNVALFQLTMSKAMLAWMNITCGNSAEATAIIADIRASIGNCCDDCSAEDGTPISGV